MKKLNFFHPLITFGFFFLVALAIYSPVFSFGFFQDDFVWLSTAKDIQKNWGLVFSTPISHFFMPTVYTYFTLAFSFFSTNAFGYYLVNILLHSINASLIFILLRQLKIKTSFAWLGALIFLTLRYPLESVVWISAITILLTCFFLLITSIFWLHFLKTKKIIPYLLSILFTVLLIFTKEWSVLLVPWLIIITILFFSQTNTLNKNKIIYSLNSAVPHLGMITVYLIFQKLFQSEGNPLIENGWYTFGPHVFPNILNNILLTFFPHTNLAHTQTNLWFIAANLFVIFLLGIGYWQFRKQKKPLFLCGTLWMIIAFFPTSLFTWDPFVSRYSYLPTLGLVFIIVSLLDWFYKKNKNSFITLFTITVIILYIFGNALFTNKVIRVLYAPIYNEISIFHQALEKNEKPKSSIIIANNTPHKEFILPDIFFALYDIPQENTQILSIDDCKKTKDCLLWQPNQKIFLINEQ